MEQKYQEKGELEKIILLGLTRWTTEIQRVHWMKDVLMRLQGVKEGICPSGGGNSHLMDLRTFWESKLFLQDFLTNCE